MADLGIRGGRVVAIGRLDRSPAVRRIDAGRSIVASEFIDRLGQYQLTVLVDPLLPSKIYHGITTSITGEGRSGAPLVGATRARRQPLFNHYNIKTHWTTFAEYFARLERQRIGSNFGSYVGATSLRESVIGEDNWPATPADERRALAVSSGPTARTLLREK